MSSVFDEDKMLLSGFKTDPEPKWMELAPMLEKRHAFGAVALDENQLIVTGGSDGRATLIKSVSAYDKRTNDWASDGWPDLNVERCYHSSVICNNKVYVVGGYNRDEYNNRFYVSSIKCLDLSSSSPKWLKLQQKLQGSRRSFAAVAVGNLIYMIGGYDGKSRLSSVEVFDTNTGLIHQDQPNMVSVRNACAAALVGNKIWVVGGIDNDRNTLNTFEYLEVDLDTGLSTGQWTISASIMTTERCSTGMAVVGHCLVITGGKDKEKKRLSSAEVFDTERGVIWRLPDMRVPRYACAAVTMEGSDIVVLGGHGNNVCHSSVESLTLEFNGVKTCFELSEYRCIESLTIGNIKTVVKWAYLLDASHLMKACLALIQKNAKVLFVNFDFLSLCLEDPELWKCIVEKCMVV